MIAADVEAAVFAVSDPELGGLSIADLGLVHEVLVDELGGVSVTLLPTFLGCPALSLIASDVDRAARVAGASACVVTWSNTPRWSAERITPSGVAHLGALGIAVASANSPEPLCPTCGTSMLRSVSPVGATACRSVAWCSGCRSVIDVLGGDREASYAHV
jgi:ring-1,2-phenylacetyl-CoA epoxidase subunit PaaD